MPRHSTVLETQYSTTCGVCACERDLLPFRRRGDTFALSHTILPCYLFLVITQSLTCDEPTTAQSIYHNLIPREIKRRAASTVAATAPGDLLSHLSRKTTPRRDLTPSASPTSPLITPFPTRYTQPLLFITTTAMPSPRLFRYDSKSPIIRPSFFPKIDSPAKVI
jgi:hypothetical protein